MIDIIATREAYERREIDNMSWIRSEHNVADMLTELKTCDVLKTVLDSGNLNLIIEQ